MPDGSFELVTHPGYNDSDLANTRTRLLASRELEVNALRMITFAPDIQLIQFADIAFNAEQPV